MVILSWIYVLAIPYPEDMRIMGRTLRMIGTFLGISILGEILRIALWAKSRKKILDSVIWYHH